MDGQIEQPPAVPAQVRTIAYYVGLGWSGAASAALGIVFAVAPQHTAVVVAACIAAVSTSVGMVVSGLGAIYRPTASQGLPGGPSQ